jgi:hypothetical protein
MWSIGVRTKYLQIGDRAALTGFSKGRIELHPISMQHDPTRNSRSIFCWKTSMAQGIGRVIQTHELHHQEVSLVMLLLLLLSKYPIMVITMTTVRRTGRCFPIDIYGQGPHMEEIKAFANKNNLPVS